MKENSSNIYIYIYIYLSIYLYIEYTMYDKIQSYLKSMLKKAKLSTINNTFSNMTKQGHSQNKS